MKPPLFTLLTLAVLPVSLPAQMFRPAIANDALIGGAIVGHNSSGRHTGEGALLGALAGALIGEMTDQGRRPEPIAQIVTRVEPVQPVVYASQPPTVAYVESPPSVVYVPVTPPPTVVYESVGEPGPVTVIYASGAPYRVVRPVIEPVVILQRPAPRVVLYRPAPVVYAVPERSRFHPSAVYRGFGWP